MAALPTTLATEQRIPHWRGLSAGMTAGGLCVIGGILLSFTGIGLIIGLPLIACGLIMPLYGLLAPGRAITGSCPYCDFPLTIAAGRSVFRCAVCKRRIGVRPGEFVGVEGMVAVQPNLVERATEGIGVRAASTATVSAARFCAECGARRDPPNAATCQCGARFE